MFFCCSAEAETSVEQLDPLVNAEAVLGGKGEAAKADLSKLLELDQQPAIPVSPKPDSEDSLQSKPVDGTLVLVFDINGESTKFEVTQRPLLLDLSIGSTSIRVFDNKKSLLQGVPVDATLTKVGDRLVADMGTATAMSTLRSALETLPLAALPADPPGAFIVEFDSGYETRKVAFEKGPLSITFDAKVPLNVKRVGTGGIADSLGVKAGWVFKAIGGKDLADMEYASVLDLIKVGSAKLPR